MNFKTTSTTLGLSTISKFTGFKSSYKDSKKVDGLENRIKMWRETFELVAENSEFVATTQLGPMLKSIGFHVDDEELPYIFDQEEMRLGDFLKIAIKKYKQTENERKLKEAFRSFDLDKCGYISAEILRHVMCYMGDQIKEDTTDEILRQFEIDPDDDEVDYLEIVSILSQSRNMIKDFVK
ncbi:calmodulin, flagellar-like [Onthophagus taurus]|uniref:calmodulin, flagellar-like n=1 Tax=Onthophagus taurus TaxID=166361 RepID=UPI0039BE87E2